MWLLWHIFWVVWGVWGIARVPRSHQGYIFGIFSRESERDPCGRLRTFQEIAEASHGHRTEPRMQRGSRGSRACEPAFCYRVCSLVEWLPYTLLTSQQRCLVQDVRVSLGRDVDLGMRQACAPPGSLWIWQFLATRINDLVVSRGKKTTKKQDKPFPYQVGSLTIQPVWERLWRL